jgi:hypothetical protein
MPFTLFPPTLFTLATQFTLKERDLSPFFSVRLLHLFALFFTLVKISPVFATLAKNEGVGPLSGLMSYLKSVTIPRLVVPTVLSSFLVSFSPSELHHGL